MKQAMLFVIVVSFYTSLTCALPENLNFLRMSTEELQAKIHQEKVKILILQANLKCLAVLHALQEKRNAQAQKELEGLIIPHSNL